MFIIEVDFGEGETDTESVLLKRTYARIGPSETSHLILDGIVDFPCDILIAKSLGSRFKCVPVQNKGLDNRKYEWIGEYEYSTDLNIGDVTISITSIDPSLAEYLLGSEFTTVRDDIYQCYKKTENLLPALYLEGEIGLGLSIGDITSCMIGKSRSCLFRLEHPLISQEEALITRNKSQFYIENYRNDKKVMVNGRAITSKRTLNGGDRIKLQKKLDILFLNNEQDLDDLIEESGVSPFTLSPIEPLRYLRCLSGDSHPSTLPLKKGQTIKIGRDPFHPVWINAPFVSRLHVEILVLEDGYEIIDRSSNGTRVNNVKLTIDKPEFFEEGIIELTLGTSVKFLISSLNKSDYLVWKENKDTNRNQENILKEHVKNNLNDQIFDIENIQEVNSDQSESVSQKIEQDKETKENIKNETFVDFQRRTIREKKSFPGIKLDPSLTHKMEQYTYEAEPKTGISKFAIFLISIVILMVLGVFLFFAKNLMH